MRVLSVNHGPQVRSELFGEVIVEDGHELVEWEIGAEPQPDGGFDAVLVLGGHQNVGEEADHPWLHDEYELLRAPRRRRDAALSRSASARRRSPTPSEPRSSALPIKQAGFVEVRLTPEGVDDPVLGVLPPRFEALVGNGYGFAVPPGAVDLADSDATPQGFRIGSRAWAVQFHPEARLGQVLGWWRTDGEESLPRPFAELERELEAKIQGWHELGRELCRAFLAVAAL